MRRPSAPACSAYYFGQGGELVWLSAGGEGSLGLYHNLGFREVGTQLNYALPASLP